MAESRDQADDKKVSPWLDTVGVGILDTFRKSVSVAYHEAGHCVMAIACGFSVTRVSVTPSDVGRGHVEFLMPESMTEITRKKAALVFAAGAAGDYHAATQHQHLEGEDSPNGHFDDQRRFHEVLQPLNINAKFIHYIAFANYILSAQWGPVDAIARKLVSEGVFNVDELPALEIKPVSPKFVEALDEFARRLPAD